MREEEVTMKVNYNGIKVKVELMTITNDVVVDSITGHLVRYFFSLRNKNFKYDINSISDSSQVDISDFQQWMGLTDNFNYNKKERESFENHPLIKGKEDVRIYYQLEDGNQLRLTKID
jgi:hypothetical protein